MALQRSPDRSHHRRRLNVRGAGHVETGSAVNFCDGVAQSSFARPDETGDDMDVEEVLPLTCLFRPSYMWDAGLTD